MKTFLKTGLTDDELCEQIDENHSTHFVQLITSDEFGWNLLMVPRKRRERKLTAAEIEESWSALQPPSYSKPNDQIVNGLFG